MINKRRWIKISTILLRRGERKVPRKEKSRFHERQALIGKMCGYVTSEELMMCIDLLPRLISATPTIRVGTLHRDIIELEICTGGNLSEGNSIDPSFLGITNSSNSTTLATIFNDPLNFSFFPIAGKKAPIKRWILSV